MIVADASPLIALTKVGKLSLLKDLYGELAIVPAVRREVVERGRTIGAPGALEVEAGIAGPWIREVQLTTEARKLTESLLRISRLGDGEAESLALARSENLTVVLDDKEARVMAEAMDVRYLGTAGVLLEAFTAGCLSYAELEEAVRDLAMVLWLSPDVVAEIIKRARELRQ